MITKTYLKNGMVLLSSERGIIDTRNNALYSEVVVKEKSVRYFKEADTKEE